MASRPHLDFHGNTLKRREVAGFALREIYHQPGVFIPSTPTIFVGPASFVFYFD
jgi:hypothetical protein